MRPTTKYDNDLFINLTRSYNSDLSSNSGDQTTDIAQIFQIAIDILSKQREKAEKEQKDYLQTFNNRQVDGFEYLHYQEARARHYCYFQMFNFLIIKNKQEQGLQNLQSLQEPVLGSKLPELDKTSIKKYIKIHCEMFKFLEKKLKESQADLTSFLNLATSARYSYHHQMYHALNMELSMLALRESGESDSLVSFKKEVETAINSVHLQERTNFIQDQIHTLKSKQDPDSIIKLHIFNFLYYERKYNEGFHKTFLQYEESAASTTENSSTPPASTI